MELPCNKVNSFTGKAVPMRVDNAARLLTSVCAKLTTLKRAFLIKLSSTIKLSNTSIFKAKDVVICLESCFSSAFRFVSICWTVKRFSPLVVKYSLDEKEHEFKSQNKQEDIKKNDGVRTFLSVLDIQIGFSFTVKDLMAVNFKDKKILFSGI